MSGCSLTYSTPSFRETLGVKVVKALKRKDDAISHAAVDTLCALMQVSAYNIMCGLILWKFILWDLNLQSI